MSYNRREPKPEVRKVDLAASGFTGSNDPRFRGVTTTLPAKMVGNTRSDMDLLKLHSTGALKGEATGNYCGECTHFYKDPNISTKQGRCKARGFFRVSEDTPADYRPHGWTDPESGISFSEWPSCPLYQTRDRLRRK